MFKRKTLPQKGRERIVNSEEDVLLKTTADGEASGLNAAKKLKTAKGVKIDERAVSVFAPACVFDYGPHRTAPAMRLTEKMNRLADCTPWTPKGG